MTPKGSVFKWFVLVALVFGSAVLNYSNLIFASRAVDVMEIYSMSQAQLTALSGIGLLPGAFFSVLMGRFFDKRGPRTIRFIGAVLLLLAALCQLWRVFASSYIEIVAITFLSGTFFLPTQVLPAKVISAWFDRSESALAMGIFGASAGIGISMAFALGSVFSTTFIALMSCTIGFFCSALLWVAFVKIPQVNSSFGVESDAAAVTSSEASPLEQSIENLPGEQQAIEEEKQLASKPRISVKAVLTSKTMLLIMFCSLFASGTPLFLNSYMVNAFLSKGMDVAQTSILGVVFNVFLIIGAIAAGAAAARLGRFNGLYLGLGIGGGAFLLFAYLAPAGFVTYVLIAIAGLLASSTVALNMGRIALIPLTGDFGPENTGIAGGMNNTAMGLGGVIVPTIAAIFVGGNYLAAFITVFAFFALIALVGGLWVPELGENGKLAQTAKNNSTKPEA